MRDRDAHGGATGAGGLMGDRVTVLGLGIEGVDLVRYLTAEGAVVTVSDSRPAEALAAQLESIADCNPTLSLGDNRIVDMTSADAVFVSQGVPRDLPALRVARERGVPLSSMSQLFFERCPAPIAGITGSSGKTTTTALTAGMLERAEIDHVVGGNIGIGLLALLKQITPDTRVVIELSHTQLETLDRSPALACVTNVTPNHLDRYPWERYVALKRRIIDFQGLGDLAILNADDERCLDFSRRARGRVAFTSIEAEIPGDGATLEDDWLVRRSGGEIHRLLRRDEVSLRGEHNLANVLQAAAVAAELGAPDAAITEIARSFAGVPHRLEPVRRVAGVLYINDSIATTPERTLAGLRSFDQPIVLLLGGRDKHLPLRELALFAAGRCRAVITFGEAGGLFAAAVHAAASEGPAAPSEGALIDEAGDVADAVSRAQAHARAGDIVLFAPAGTSFDAYRTFEARGQEFRRAVAELGGAP